MNQDIVYKYFEGIKNIEESILQYLESEDSENNYFESLIDLIDNFNISTSKHHLQILLHLISKISNNHFRNNNFFPKIEKIIKKYKNIIKIHFSNSQIFKIFENNKRILLFLFEEQILIPDQLSFKEIRRKYENFFYKEFKSYYNERDYIDISDEDRKIGESNHYICQIIRDDLTIDFISYTSQANIGLSSKIKDSIYETNPYLLKNSPSLIQYAAFFGSINIFRYLLINDVDLDSSLWIYAIHGNNPEIIHLLEERKIEPKDDTFTQCLAESIKCHHTNLSNYFESNYFQDSNYNKLMYQSVKSCNFIEIYDLISQESFSFYDIPLIENELKCKISRSLFFNFCKYGYLDVIDFLIKNTNINVNHSDKYYKSPSLTLAVENEDIDLIKLLLINPDVCFTDIPKYASPLHIAISQNNLNIVKLLLQHKNIDINSNALIKAVSRNYNEITKLLLNHPKINVNECLTKYMYKQEKTIELESALIIAIQNNNIEIIKLLLNHPNIDVNKISTILNKESEMQKKTALMVAIQNNYIEAVKLILNNKSVDVNIKSTITKNWYWENEETTALNMAVENENIEIIKLLLNKNVKNSQPNKNFKGKTALNIAVEKNNLEIVKALLNNQNIDPNTKSIKGYKEEEETALMIAISRNNMEIIKLLLNHPNIEINPQPKYGDTALNIALRNKNYEIVKLLLSKPSIDINSHTILYRKRETALYTAVKNNSIELIPLLLSIPNIDINFLNENEYTKETTLNLSIRNNNIEIVKILLNNENINANIKSIMHDNIEETALTIAIKNNNIEIIKLLLNLPNIEINPQPRLTFNGDTALNIAITNNYIEIAKLLLSMPNIDVNSVSKNYLNRYTALSIAINKNNMEIINLLLENKNIDVNLRNIYISDHRMETNALNMAVEKEDIELIKLLLKNKNIQNLQPKWRSVGKTALNIAVEKNNIKIVNLLLENPNINVNAKSHFINEYSNFEEETALMIAIKNNNMEIIKLLLSHPNIDVNPQPNYLFDGDTALNIALRNKNYEIAKLLLSKPNIDVNSQTIYCNKIRVSPLHLAIEQNNWEIIQLLFSHSNIDVNSIFISVGKLENFKMIRYHFEKTPIHMAAEKNNFEVMKILLSHPNIDINYKSYYDSFKTNLQKTALHIAIENENIDILKLLLENPKTNVNIKLIHGHEEHELIEKSNMHSPKIIKDIIELKTPLYIAVEKKNAEIIQFLLKRHDIDINCKSNFNMEKTYYQMKNSIGIRYLIWKKEKSIFDEIIHVCNQEIQNLFKNANVNL